MLYVGEEDDDEAEDEDDDDDDDDGGGDNGDNAMIHHLHLENSFNLCLPLVKRQDCSVQ